MLGVVMLNIIMLTVVLLKIIMLTFVLLSVIRLTVVLLSVIILNVVMLNVVVRTIHWAGKECLGQTTQLIGPTLKLQSVLNTNPEFFQ
jgi:hypothetical protein